MNDSTVPPLSTLASTGVYVLRSLNGVALPLSVPRSNIGTPPLFPVLQLIADTLRVLDANRFSWTTVLQEPDSATTYATVIGGYFRAGPNRTVAYATSGWTYDQVPNFPVAELRSVSADAIVWNAFGPWLGPVTFDLFAFQRIQ